MNLSRNDVMDRIDRFNDRPVEIKSKTRAVIEAEVAAYLARGGVIAHPGPTQIRCTKVPPEWGRGEHNSGRRIWAPGTPVAMSDFGQGANAKRRKGRQA